MGVEKNLVIIIMIIGLVYLWFRRCFVSMRWTVPKEVFDWETWPMDTRAKQKAFYEAAATAQVEWEMKMMKKKMEREKNMDEETKKDEDQEKGQPRKKQKH